MGASLKVCGITRVEDWRSCDELGVDYIGLNFWPQSRRFVSLQRATAMWTERERERSTGQAARLVALFVDPKIEEVLEVLDALPIDLVQFHGELGPAAYPELKCPQIHVIRGTPAISSLSWPARRIDHVLLDAMVSGYGGQGHRADWDWAAQFVAHASSKSVWLAGGITPENAAEALAQVRCAGLDVASGAELSGAKHGEKDPKKIQALLECCRASP